MTKYSADHNRPRISKPRRQKRQHGDTNVNSSSSHQQTCPVQTERSGEEENRWSKKPSVCSPLETRGFHDAVAVECHQRDLVLFPRSESSNRERCDLSDTPDSAHDLSPHIMMPGILHVNDESMHQDDTEKYTDFVECLPLMTSMTGDWELEAIEISSYVEFSNPELFQAWPKYKDDAVNRIEYTDEPQLTVSLAPDWHLKDFRNSSYVRPPAAPLVNDGLKDEDDSEIYLDHKRYPPLFLGSEADTDIPAIREK